jgi:hypothetical protein
MSRIPSMPLVVIRPGVFPDRVRMVFSTTVDP